MVDLQPTTIAAQLGLDSEGHVLGHALGEAMRTRISIRLSEPTGAFLVTDNANVLLVNEWRDQNGGKAFWLGPNKYMHIGPNAPPGNVHVTDITGGIAIFDISGPAWRDVFARGSSLDPDSDLFTQAKCAQMQFAGVKALVHSHAPDQFFVQVDRPFSEFLVI
jgi:sarcosine oxidase gamma subunit